MARTVFDQNLGVEQGRLANASGYTAPEGAHLFVLGWDSPGTRAALAPADYSEVSQVGTFGAAKAISMRARLRGPQSPMEGDLAWFAQIRIDDVVIVERELHPRRTRTLSDLVVPVGALAGEAHKLAFRLVLRGTIAPTSEVQIPALYLDALVLDAGYTRPRVVNRSPEPGETSVPADAAIELDIIDVGPDGIDDARTTVRVDGVIAYQAGSFAAAFDGARASSTNPAPGTLRLVLDPIVPFASDSVVAVTVDTAVVGGLVASTSYGFAVADLTPPRLLSVTPNDEARVRLLFTEAVTGVTAAGITIVRTDGEISVPVRAVEVAALTDRETEVTLDQEITPGATYTITVAGVTDLFANTLADPYNTAVFTGFVCPGPAAREWSFFDMLPQINRDEDSGDLLRFMTVLQEIGDRSLCRIDRFTEIIDPDLAPVRFVNAMLDDLGNPFIEEAAALSEIDRRRLVQLLVPLYKLKGTDPGIRSAIRFFLGVEVSTDTTAVGPIAIGLAELGEDWVLGTSDPIEKHTFRVLSPRALTALERKRLIRIVTHMKFERDHFRVLEPASAPLPEDLSDHLELGVSELGYTWLLH